jgi:hypothetical protein
MLRRLRRPGYWIILLIVLTVYFYRAYQVREQQRREALFRLYRSYGEEVLGSLRERNLTALQRRFPSGENGRISLEDIAMFVTTLHLDKSPGCRWKDWEENEGNVTLHGDLILEGNLSYPLDMMMVKRGNELLLNRLRVGPRTLELHRKEFPFTSCGEENLSSLPQTSHP